MRLLARSQTHLSRAPTPKHHLARPPRRIVTTSTISPAPIDVPRLLVTPGSPYHNSLSSFLAYAQRTRLAPTSSVHVGTTYEYVTAASLRRLGFSLLRTGRKNDAGIDLIGHWVLPCLRDRAPLPVFVQCKAWKKHANTANIRELEGSFRRVPPEWRSEPNVLGVLVTQQQATRGVREHMDASPRPLAFLQVSREGVVTQLRWNRAAAERGLEGVGVTLRYMPLLPRPAEENKKAKKGEEVPWMATDIQLTYMGEPIFAEREELARETEELIPVVKREIPPPRPRGRPKVPGGKKVKVKATRPRGRPRKTEEERAKKKTAKVSSGRGRGRPKGSKNKVKKEPVDDIT